MIETIRIKRRFGKIDPLLIEDYLNNKGYVALKKALLMDKEKIVNEVMDSRLSGRGGAAFPSGLKMKSMFAETGVKYIVCNADEGEPGNFKDRFLMENDPHQIIEGMIISAYATGVHKGFIYIRGEYDTSIEIMKHTVKKAREYGFLGKDILQSNFDFDIEIRTGAGAYICGEEFSLIESLEGKPGRSRLKPPFPTQCGYKNRPTLVYNLETYVNIVLIIEEGAEAFAKIGNGLSTGTKLISLSGNIKNKGVYEIPYGVTIKDAIYKLGNGITDDIPLSMVQLSGASGPIIPVSLLDMQIDNEGFDGFNGKIGAGAIIAIDERFDLFEILFKTMKFFEHESCGKCTPCREGHIQVVNIITKFIKYQATMSDLESLESLALVMTQTSLCGLGQTSTMSILSTLKYFKQVYLLRIHKSKFSVVT